MIFNVVNIPHLKFMIMIITIFIELTLLLAAFYEN